MGRGLYQKTLLDLRIISQNESHFRRSDDHRMNQHTLIYKDLEINMEARMVKRENEELELTKKEFDLLYLLLKK